MQKIAITKDELKKHKMYFNQNVIPELNKLIDIYKKRNSRRQYKFLLLCRYYRKQLSIGKPWQLRRIQKIIIQSFNDLDNDKVFKAVILKAFGYDRFSNSDIGDQILKIAKKNAEEHSRTTIRNYKDKRILNEIQIQLNTCDEALGSEFKAELDFCDDKITKDNLKDVISNILMKNIMQNSISITQWPEWNPYLLQYVRGIRTCPYCNRQYITPYYSKLGKIRADLDHFYSKSKYPYFSMSIYNLVPCCKFCNSSLKGKKEFEMDTKTPYEISIDKTASFYYHPGSCPAITFDAEDTALPYKEMFKIEELYNYHTNIAENYHYKYLDYSPLRIKDMMESGFFESKKELYLMILGKISKEGQILEEPLNKLKRDLIYEIYGSDVLELITDL